MPGVRDTFRGPIGAPWRILRQGGGRIVIAETGLRLITIGASRRSYSNAQIDDYSGLARGAFPHHPPLTLTMRARFPDPIHGTAGFGFWNAPISPPGTLPSLPAAIWFFYASPPSDIAPALDVPGAGWKAATIDLRSPRAWRWAPAAAPIMLLNRLPAARRRLWPMIQRDGRIAERRLGDPSPEWQTHTIEWRSDGARFAIDGSNVLETPYAPAGPLGFVAWVDTQWLIATPDGRFGWGLHDAPAAQALEIASIEIAGRAGKRESGKAAKR